MPGRLAIDFGTSNTVVAVWDESAGHGLPQVLPEYTQLYRQGDEDVPLIPSVIHYADAGQRWLGDQVARQNLVQSPGTFRWMKRYISNRSPVKKRAGGETRSHFDAGRDFLTSVLAVARERFAAADEEIVLTVPVESFEHYDDWLSGVAEDAGIGRYRLIDEPSAAALGYGVTIQPGDVYLIFDFGGGTLDVAVVLIEEQDDDGGGRRCRVLGKAGADIGGTVIDQWLYMDALKRNGRHGNEEDVRAVSNALLEECKLVKERLSSHDSAELTVVHPTTGATLAASYTRDDFEELLDEHEAFNEIDGTVRRALNAAVERGYDQDHVKSVLMVGGSSLIPCVRKSVQRMFGRDRVTHDRPMDAVARGAAAFVAGVDFFDHIQHDYAIRHVDAGAGGYQYTTVVDRGTAYPTAQPVFRKHVKAAYDGQVQLGIAIFEIGHQPRRRDGQRPMELVFDPSGAARVVEVTADEADQRSRFWMNEHNPTFLHADPPAQRGDARFEVEFTIDANKRLLITARDLARGSTTHQDVPVVKLT